MKYLQMYHLDYTHHNTYTAHHKEQWQSDVPLPATRNRVAFCPQIHTSPRHRRCPQSRVAVKRRRVEPYLSQPGEKTVRLSRGSSPHNRRPSRVVGGESPAARPATALQQSQGGGDYSRGISPPGTIRQRFSGRAQCPHCPLLSHGSCGRRHGVKLLLLCKLPKGFVQPPERSRGLRSPPAAG